MNISKTKYFLLTKTVGLWLNFLAVVAPQKAKNLSYKLFSEPRDGKLNPDALFEVLQNVPLEYVNLDEHQFPVYHWENSGATVLLVHGWESNSARWEKMLPFLFEKNYNIIAVDAPGHGLASGKEFNIPLYSKFLNAVSKKYSPSAIVGHSLGGATAVYFMKHYWHPSIRKMVLLGAPSDLEVLLSNYGKLLSLKKQTLRLLDKYYVEHFNLHPKDFSGKLFATEIDAETLIVHDVNDETVLLAESEKHSQAFKNSSFITTNNLGHSLHDESLYKKVIEFLK